MVWHPFAQIDVFTDTVYSGNPVAVVLDAYDLGTEQMQRLARWTNLSETTFVLPPTDPAADYQVRIFTPSVELPFAGHPTLGTCHAWLGHYPGHTSDEIVQQCPAGLVRIRRTPYGLAFAAPPLMRQGPVDEPTIAHLATRLGVARSEVVDAQWVDNGPGWLGFLLRDAETVSRLRPNLDQGSIGVIGPHPSASPHVFEVRAFVASNGTTSEDPVTGSLNASLAQWLIATGRAHPPYVVSQGSAVGAAGRVHIETDDDGAVWVGGGTITAIEGRVDL